MTHDSPTGARTRIARNALWNLLGFLLPVPTALVCIPVLIAGLGIERFGALGIAWTVMAYFGLFDLGLSLSTTRFAAADVARKREDALPALLAGSVLLHTALGLAGGALLGAAAPWLASHVFAMSASLTVEMETALYWLAISIPAIVVTSALRGMLEGLQRFDLVNLIRTPAAILNYVGPVAMLPFGTTLPLVVGVIAVARYAVLIAFAVACLKAMPRFERSIRLDRARLTRLASFGGWLTVSNLVNPLMIATDRFVIATVVSVGAVAFYITPFEIITKAWILSASVMAAVFPALAAAVEHDPGSMRGACRTAEVHLIALAAPAVAVVLGCADRLLEWWLGPEFSQQSTWVAQLLGLGILVNVTAQVPLTALHAMGRADLTAKIVMAELPVYAVAAWYCATRYGITGVAAVWAARAAVDALLLFATANAVLPPGDRAGTGTQLTPAGVRGLCLFLAAFWLAGIVWRDEIAWRLAALAVLFPALLLWEWIYLLRPDDREHLLKLWNRTQPGRAP